VDEQIERTQEAGMKQAYKHRRGFSATFGLVLSAVALLALAGTASAHHHHHGGSSEPAGTISSYDPDTGVLTIDLAKGGSVSGLVTEDTRIEVGGGCHGKGGEERHGRHGRRAGHAARHNSGGDHGGWGWHHGWDHGHQGSTDDLVPGAVVDDAFLVLVDGDAVFAKVELETPQSSSAS
jgi:hypothetical protein